MNNQVKADLLLLLVTFFWGATYVFTKVALETFAPYTLIALRFVIAFGVMALMFHKRWKLLNKKTVWYAFLLSLLLFLTFICMTFGLMHTSASNVSFLAGLGVIVIPMISSVMERKLPNRKLIFCVLLATVGICLLTINENLKLSMNFGDFLALMIAVIYAFFIVGTDSFARQVDPVLLSVLEMGFVGLFSTLVALKTETWPSSPTPSAWMIVFFLSVLCTAFAYAAQTVAQCHTNPTHTGIIMSMEIVFSGIFAYLLLNEVLSPLNYTGAVMLLACILIMEVDWSLVIKGKAFKEKI